MNFPDMIDFSKRADSN